MIRVARTIRLCNGALFAFACAWLRFCGEEEERTQRQVHVDALGSTGEGEGEDSGGYVLCSGWDAKVSHGPCV